jgi:hypothetical protein
VPEPLSDAELQTFHADLNLRWKRIRTGQIDVTACERHRIEGAIDALDVVLGLEEEFIADFGCEESDS